MLRLFALFVALFVASCALSGSVSNKDPDKTHEVMITFVTKARAGFWREAMENVTPDEREEMMDGGHVLPEYEAAIGRLRMSAIKKMNIGLDRKGRLVGIKDVLDGSNDMAAANSDKVLIDPETLKDYTAEQAKRKRDEEERQRKEREEKEEEEEEDPDNASFLESLLKQAPKDN
ncbi:MAG: hypothetical protein LBH25_02580 [Fibromonadaceae bacterium]|jgi:hypothetical protein|nr:hypothetical protein [Fibromonadaceae bacterium]